MKHYKLRIAGRVQDVSFRDNAKAYADQHGIKGSVRNESDGTVILEVAGEDGEIDGMVDWLRNSPGNSWVSSINSEAAESRDFDQFEIQR
jgi:acylphosphatase